MLCITMQAGDYFTVGEHTVVQFSRMNGDRAHLMIHAPREVPILRGEVLERRGGRRPACLMDVPPQPVRQLPWNAGKQQALTDLRRLLAQMEEGPERRSLEEALERLFPSPSPSPSPENGQTERLGA